MATEIDPRMGVVINGKWYWLHGSPAMKARREAEIRAALSVQSPK
jgi:hypothetical protein